MSEEKKKVISELKQLYSDIDDNITDLVKSRLQHDKVSEQRCLRRMEQLNVACQQDIIYMLDYLTHLNVLYDDGKQVKCLNDISINMETKLVFI